MPLFLVKTQSHLLGFLLNQLLSVVWKYSWDISVPLSVNGKLMLAHKVLITSTVLRSNINQFWWNLLHMFRLTCPVDVVQNRKFLLKFKMAAIAAILETAKRNGSGKHRPIWMKFWHYFSCDIPAFLIFAPKFQSILWLRASLQSLISSGGRGGGEYSPHSINTSHSFNCGLPATSKFAPKMPNIYSTITLVNGNFYAATVQQWRKMGCKFPPHPLHHWFLFCFKLWPTDSSSVRSKITWSVTVQLLWWMRTCMQPVRNSGGRRGANSPRINENFFIFQVVTFREHQYLAKYCLKCGGAIGLINEVIYPLPLNSSGWIWDSRRNVGLNPPELRRFSFLNCDLPKNSVKIACNHAEISPSQTGPLRL